jgi:hypothetical protein
MRRGATNIQVIALIKHMELFWSFKDGRTFNLFVAFLFPPFPLPTIIFHSLVKDSKTTL